MAKITSMEKASVLRQNLEADVIIANGLINKEDAESRKAYAELVSDFADRVKTLNGNMQAEEFAILRDAERPMMAAILKLMIPKVSVSLQVDSETKVASWQMKDSASVINLVAFENFCGGKAIANVSGWRYTAEHFAKLLSARVTKDLGGDADTLMKEYRLSKTARKDQTQEPIPTSNTQLTKALQKLIDMILFDDNGSKLNQYKVTSEDVHFMLYLAVKAAKEPKTATMPQAKTVISLTAQIINRIVTGTAYTSLYKRNED